MSHLAVQPDMHLVKVPARCRNPRIGWHVGCEQSPKSVPPQPRGLKTNIDIALAKKVFDIPQREGKPDVHHHREMDHFRR
nr:hypothetical protein [Caenibius tardaugens]